MKISVVVPTYNRSRLLSLCIESLLKQTYASYEIIVVNDGSSDNTGEVVSGFVKRSHRVRLFSNRTNRGEAASRNVGIRNAKGEIIAFVDDDCVADNDLLKNIVKTFSKTKSLAGVEGKTVPARLPLRPFEHSLANTNGGMYTTSNMAYRAGIIKKIGCDERLRLANRVDTDLAFTTLERGEKLTFEPKACVKHAVLRTSFAAKLRRKTLFMNDALLLKKHKMLYKRYVKFPFERFTPLYILFSLLSVASTYFALLLIAVALYELVYRKYKFSLFDFVRFLILQTVGSWVVLAAVFYGSYKFRVNPLGFLV
jgi:glycosyltransferase involved in cell wall biosynthesis